MTTNCSVAKTVSIVLILAVSCFLPRFAFAYTPYIVFDLGTLGGDISDGRGVNNAGTVVGTAQDAGGIYRAFSWTFPWWQQYLGTLGERSMANAINESGLIAGTSFPTNTIGHAFLWDEVHGMQDLGTLGGLRSGADDINESGQIVGSSKLPGSNDSRPFLWETSAGMHDLGTLPGHPVGAARAINDIGVVVGQSVPSTGNLSHAVMWDVDGSIIDIGLFGRYTSASDINNVGQVVGAWHDIDGGTYWNAFLWTVAGGWVDLPELDDGTSVIYTSASAINNRGEVVGNSAGWAFIWDETNGMRKLNDLLPLDSGWDLLYANDINDNGWIVGQGRNLAGELHGYLLVPEPASATLLLLGLSGLVWRRKRSLTRHSFSDGGR